MRDIPEPWTLKASSAGSRAGRQPITNSGTLHGAAPNPSAHDRHVITMFRGLDAMSPRVREGFHTRHRLGWVIQGIPLGEPRWHRPRGSDLVIAPYEGDTDPPSPFHHPRELAGYDNQLRLEDRIFDPAEQAEVDATA